MDLKKSYKANLERRIGLHLFVGLIITLSFILIGFEWTVKTDINEQLQVAKEIDFDPELMQLIKREDSKPRKPIPIITPTPIPVDEDIPLDTKIDWDTEPDYQTWFDFPSYSDPGIEVIDDSVHIIVEIPPTFNNGDPNVEFFRFILKNLNYPRQAAENGISGRVLVQFVISKEGVLEDARVMRRVHPALDNEALRVINSSPRWEPGIQSGRRVHVMYTFPINFVLR